MSHGQPNPYGQPDQPQQPNPYAQGSYPPPPGRPPQQPPYGQQPYGMQPGMPAPYPPPAPPQRGSKGKVIGIAIGVVVLIGAIGGGAYSLFKGADGGDGKVKPYTIALPDKLLDGQYSKKTTPLSERMSKMTNEKIAKAVNIPNGKAVSAAYDNSQKQGLSIAGDYGDVADPRKAVDDYLALLDKQQKENQQNLKDNQTDIKVETVTPLTDFHPKGFDGAVMKCESQKSTFTMKSTITNSEQSTTMEVSFCIWGDSSAVGIVQHEVSKSDGPDDSTGNVMPIKDLSETTAKVRNEIRKDK